MSQGIQASPPQKPEKEDAPAPVQSSPLQGQSVLSYSPSRPPSTSPKFSPSCVPGYSPSLQSPPTARSGGSYSPVTYTTTNSSFMKVSTSRDFTSSATQDVTQGQLPE